jgi:two-component system phosphate regulon response regulator PhoB
VRGGVIITDMSVLNNKKALVIGPGNLQVFSLIEALEAEGVQIVYEKSSSVEITCFDDVSIDFVLANNSEHDDEVLRILRTSGKQLVERAIPVFVLVEDKPDAIQQALSLGAADCLTAQEDNESIIAKIKAVFGSAETFAGSTAIDISLPEANITKKGIRVLIVEDDPLLRNLLALKLDKTHFPYAFSTDGDHIVSTMQQFKPNIVILDLMLPGRTGFEVLADIKADAEMRSVPVIVFSNRDSQEDRARAHELGAHGFYVKAMTDLSELIETIESVVT